MIVATAIDRAFVEPASVLFASIAANGNIPDADLTIFGLDLTPGDHDAIRASSGQMADRVSFVNLNFAEDHLKRFPVTWSVPSVVAYARLLIPDILTRPAGRLLYLDSDIVVNGSLRPLLETPLNNMIAAAVPDQLPDEATKAYRSQSLRLEDPLSYLNSGVLLIDIEAWRRAKKGEEAFAFLDSFPPGQLKYLDQDVLNVILAGCWTHLDRRWNFFHYGHEPAITLDGFRKAEVVHFASGTKPWFRDTTHPAKDLYLHYRSMTPFSHARLFSRNEQAVRQIIRSPRATLKNMAIRLMNR